MPTITQYVEVGSPRLTIAKDQNRIKLPRGLSPEMEREIVSLFHHIISELPYDGYTLRGHLFKDKVVMRYDSSKVLVKEFNFEYEGL